MKLRAAVVGVGYLGRFHAQKYKNNPDVELVGVCDGRAEQAAAVAKELSVQAYSDPRQLFGKVDLVTIAASTQAHFDLGLLFLDAGIPVNLEKPLAATADQARQLVDLAERRQTILGVGHVERFNPVLLELKKEIKGWKFFDLIRHTPFRARGADVSVLHDLMIHDLDMLFWLSGEGLGSFQATGAHVISKTIDACEVFVEMSNGRAARISASRISNRPQRTVRVIENNRALLADSATMEVEVITPVDVNAAEPLSISKKIVEKKDALQAETDAFVTAVKNGTRPVVSGIDGLHALEAVEKILSRLGSSR